MSKMDLWDLAIFGGVIGFIVGLLAWLSELPDEIKKWKAEQKELTSRRKKQEQKEKGFIAYYTPEKKRTLAERLTT